MDSKTSLKTSERGVATPSTLPLDPPLLDPSETEAISFESRFQSSLRKPVRAFLKWPPAEIFSMTQ